MEFSPVMTSDPLMTEAHNREQLELNNRFERGSLLQETDWTQLSDVSSSVQSQYTSYRQALRDLPTHANWPQLTPEDWPVKPE
jgi:hypothetical protein